MANPYEPPLAHAGKALAQERQRFTLSRSAAIGIWILGFGLQLAAYVTIISVMLFGSDQPYSGNATAASEIEFDPDLFQVLFNFAIILFGCLSIFAIIKCRDFTPGNKWSASGGSALLFFLCWCGFMYVALVIAFSGGFQGE